MENNKNVIRLTEEDLNNIIKESVQQILKENPENEGLWGRIKGGVQGVGNAIKGEFNKAKNGVMNAGLNNEYQGQSVKNRFNSAKNYISQSAKTGDRKQEFDRFIKQLNDYMQQGILGKQGTAAAQTLIKCIQQSMRGDQGRLIQNYNKNGYK